MGKKKKKIYIAVAIAIILTILLISCASKPEYIFINKIPTLTFPDFPDPKDVKYNDESGIVSMPLSYWLSIVEYKIDIDTLKKIYAEYEKQ